MESLKLHSPDGRIEVTFGIRHIKKDQGTKEGCAVYSIRYDGKELLLDSCLELVLRNEGTLGAGLRLKSHAYSSVRSEWKPLYGERSLIPDRYNELTVELEELAGKRRTLQVQFRAYDEGAAFRYMIPGQQQVDRFTILAEYTQFHFPAGCYAYEEHGTEGEYARNPIASIRPDCERPLTVEYSHGAYMSLTEAATNDYARMLLSAQRGRADVLYTSLSGTVQGTAPFQTPWRVFVIGDRPGALVENNHIVLNLNEPCALADTSWILPGKAIRVTALSTDGGMRCADFAVRHGLQYIEYDAGWYGYEYDNDADASFVSLDPDRVGNIPNHGGLDLPAVIRYAADKGIGVLLYVNRRALEKQLDELLPLYRSWGITGIKFGFVQVGSQEWTTWLLEAVRKCAEYGLVVDIHDNYRPTGYSRTYPNLLTQEGIRGNEHMPTSRHNCTLPFTRFPAGAGDYTICYYDKRIKTTHAHQLALAVVVYSPLQFVFWYDTPDRYEGEPEVEFFRDVPTVWDETKVLDGDIGEYVAIARRKGGEWFVGCITNEYARHLELRLSFLTSGRAYVATLYKDDYSAAGGRTNVSIGTETVDASGTLTVALSANGGCAIRIAPAEQGG